MVHFKMMKIILMVCAGLPQLFFLLRKCMFLFILERSKPWGILEESNERLELLLQTPPPSLSPPLLFRLNIQLTVRERRQRTLHYPALCLPTSLASKHSADGVCCFVKFTTVAAFM